MGSSEDRPAVSVILLGPPPHGSDASPIDSELPVIDLCVDERLAEQYAHQPGRLRELAAATGSWPLYRVARDLTYSGKRKRKCRR